MALKTPQHRFVVLFHQMPPDSARSDHWDFMLEHEDSLATWALQREPIPTILEQGIACDQLPEHRKHYLDYEGPISNNRGHVSQWDSGSILHFEPQDERLLFRLSGRRLTGDYQLKRISDVTKSEQSKWMFYAVNGESVAQATD